MSSTRSTYQQRWISWTFFALVVGYAALLAYPQPELDFEGEILQRANKFMGRTLTDDVSQTPLEGLVVAITGSTSGIGMELTRKLSSLGATIIAIGRSPSKLDNLKQEIPSISTVIADLNDLDSVARASEDITESFERIHVLINNAGMHAGVFLLNPKTTRQGFDEFFGVNYLSHFLLTEKLIPLLLNSPKAQIIQISSSFHWGVDGSDLMAAGDNMPPTASAPGGNHGFFFFRSMRSYANAKLAQILHARALARRLPKSVQTVSVCPAWVATQIGGQKNGTAAFSAFQGLAFPANGFGLASVFKAMFRDDEHDENLDFFINTKIMQALSAGIDWMPSFMYTWLPLRDISAFIGSIAIIHFQRFFPLVGPIASSPQSYDLEIQESLYEWSKQAVSQWL
jgi:NAD(P)-dependent dehydrogenase (short-subunit alcohol dehydrogenase family)